MYFHANHLECCATWHGNELRRAYTYTSRRETGAADELMSRLYISYGYFLRPHDRLCVCVCLCTYIPELI